MGLLTMKEIKYISNYVPIFKLYDFDTFRPERNRIYSCEFYAGSLF